MFIQLIVAVASLLINYALRPHPKGPAAATLSDINIPTIEQGTPMMVVFGDVWIDEWMVCWYGDLHNTPIKAGGKKG